MVGRNKWLRMMVGCLLLAICQPVLAKSWRALVIGNQTYRGGGLGELGNPVRDAEALTAVLEQLGFEVTLHRNVTKNQFWEVFQAFKQALKAESSEVALFFFSGHGLAAGRSNYLMPVDARPEYLEDVAFHGIPMERVLEDIKTEGVRLRLIIVDACRDTANLKSKYKGRVDPGLVTMQAPVGTLIAFSSGPSQQAMDFINKGDQHSPYVAALLKYLPEAGLTAKEVFLKVGEDVAVATKEQQMPSLQTSRIGQFRFERDRGGDERRDRVEPARPERVADAGSTPTPFRRPVPEEAPPAGSRPPAGQVFRDTLGDGTRGPSMVVIPAGEFWMGSPEGEAGRFRNERQHDVRINSFAMGQYEVTFEEYDQFAAATGREKPGDEDWGRGKRPVINVSWQDAVAYTKWLSQQTGKSYRLPTEAEWEYAARAGTGTARYWGDAPAQACRYANVADQAWQEVFLERSMHDCSDGYIYTATVGSFQPNGWKLYDMLGNVWEWTGSTYKEDYTGTEQSRSKDSSDSMVIRGGSWDDTTAWVRSAYRNKLTPTFRNFGVGFRLARSL